MPRVLTCANPQRRFSPRTYIEMSAPPRTPAWAVSSPRALRLVCSWLLVIAACLGTAQGEFESLTKLHHRHFQEKSTPMTLNLPVLRPSLSVLRAAQARPSSRARSTTSAAPTRSPSTSSWDTSTRRALPARWPARTAPPSARSCAVLTLGCSGRSGSSTSSVPRQTATPWSPCTHTGPLARERPCEFWTPPFPPASASAPSLDWNARCSMPRSQPRP